jgi:hypothetical protein
MCFTALSLKNCLSLKHVCVLMSLVRCSIYRYTSFRMRPLFKYHPFACIVKKKLSLYSIYMFLLLSLRRCHCWWTISPEGFIRLVISISALAWFIRYIYYWNLQLLNNINKTMVLLPQTNAIFKLFGFSIFCKWTYLMKVIPETHRLH